MPTKVQSSPETVSDEDVREYELRFAQEREIEKVEEYFTALVKKYGPKVRNTLARKFGLDDAEDMLQETNLRAWRYRETYDPEKRFRHWYFTIAWRVAFDHYRRTRDSRKHTQLTGESDSPGSNPILPIGTAAPSASAETHEAKLLYHQMRQRCRNDHERKLLHAYILHHSWDFSWVALRNRLNWPETPQGLQKACNKLISRLLEDLNG